MSGRSGTGSASAGEEGAEAVRHALRAAALDVEPPPWPRSAIRDRARRMRRGRRLAITLPLVAAAVVTAGLLVPAPGAPAGRVRPAASAPPSPPSPSASAPAAPPPVQVVGAGRRITLGHGWWMTLESGRRCMGRGASGPTCKSTTDGNQGDGTVGVQTQGDASGTLYTPLYVGHGKPVRMTARTGGRLYDVHVITLAGDPGYATGCLWGPPTSLAVADQVRITVYDARGAVLAAFP